MGRRHDGEVERPRAAQQDPAAPDAVAPAWRVDGVRLALVALIVVFVLYFACATIAQLLNPGFGVWFSEAFIFFGLPFIVVRMSGRDPIAATGLRLPGVAPALFGFALGAANFFALAIPIQFLAQAIFPTSWSEAFDSSRIFLDRSPFDLALILSGVIIAAPIGEEFFFRGVLQNGLHESKLKAASVIGVTAVIFSAFHLDPVGFFARVELGVLFGWLYFRTRSIWPGVMAHAANNAITTVLFFAFRDAESPPAAERVTTANVMQLALFAALGLLALAALLSALKRRPSLLGRVDASERALPPRGFFTLAAPWIAAAALSLALLFGFDWRGVQLNLYDATHPLPESSKKNRIERKALSELRMKARTGLVPVDEYKARRKALIDRRKERPPLPIPEVLPPAVDPPAP